MGAPQTRQLDLLTGTPKPAERVQRDTSSTFVNNMKLPIHGWFRYSAGFSARWVEAVVRDAGVQDEPLNVFDPFVGSGTVALAAESVGANGLGIEAHPFVARVAKAKLAWRENADGFRRRGRMILAQAQGLRAANPDYPDLVTKCYPEGNTLEKLDKLRRALDAEADGTPVDDLAWLALASILRACSPVGTANWQYILPNKRKGSAADPFEAFGARVELMARDMDARQQQATKGSARILQTDARKLDGVKNNWADLIVTSPPYANNYDYADATRFEMTFFREIESWGDLQGAVRQYLIRSCTQHVAPQTRDVEPLLDSPLLDPIRDDLAVAYNALEAIRHEKGGKKPYHNMVLAYFHDLAQVWQALGRVVRPGGRACFVVGDSAPYGIHVPVDRWLGELAMASGFQEYSFEKLRDRNVKWDNRVHKVPLHEGRLWVEA